LRTGCFFLSSWDLQWMWKLRLGLGYFIVYCPRQFRFIEWHVIAFRNLGTHAALLWKASFPLFYGYAAYLCHSVIWQWKSLRSRHFDSTSRKFVQHRLFFVNVKHH
jgi:hypothetical protein